MLFDFPSVIRFLRLWLSRRPPTAKRLAVAVGFCVFFPIVEFFVWAGLWLDEFLFPAYRNQAVAGPIFIVGNFRSGTTRLHRLLARDAGLTTMRLWEIVFVPSIVGRKFFRFLVRRSRPIERVFSAWIARTAWGDHTVHTVGINEPEEDDYLLFHAFSALTVGMSSGLPELAAPYVRFDDDIPASRRRRLLAFYRRCVQRHLHADGGRRRYLAKNPALTPKLATVLETFPDARIVVLVRDPATVAASLGSMMRRTWAALGIPADDPALSQFLVDMVEHWYRHPSRLNLPENQLAFVSYNELVADPAGTVARIYHRFGLTVTPEFQTILDRAAAPHQSNHAYDLDDLGLNSAAVRARLNGLSTPPAAEPGA